MNFEHNNNNKKRIDFMYNSINMIKIINECVEFSSNTMSSKRAMEKWPTTTVANKFFMTFWMNGRNEKKTRFKTVKMRVSTHFFFHTMKNVKKHSWTIIPIRFPRSTLSLIITRFPFVIRLIFDCLLSWIAWKIGHSLLYRFVSITSIRSGRQHWKLINFMKHS